MIDVNLIPDERLDRKRRRLRLRVWTALCLLYALAVVGLSVGGYALWSTPGEALADELKAVEDKTAESSRSIETLAQELAEAEAALQASRAIGGQPDWSTLLVLLAQELGDEVVLSQCKLVPVADSLPETQTDANAAKLSARDLPLGQRRYGLKLNGFARTQTAVSQFVLRLERIELFEQVKLVKGNRQSFMTGQAVAFEIDCSI